MYPVRLGYKAAIDRIKRLRKNSHHAEALVTSMFTVEKTLRRTLRQIVVSAGFTSGIADKIIGKLRGLDAIKNAWELYEPHNKKLTEIISQQDWNTFKKAAEMRNKMTHGERVYNLDKCKNMTDDILSALERLKHLFDRIYEYSGWSALSKRIQARLHTDPKVRI